MENLKFTQYQKHLYRNRLRRINLRMGVLKKNDEMKDDSGRDPKLGPINAQIERLVKRQRELEKIVREL